MSRDIWEDDADYGDYGEAPRGGLLRKIVIAIAAATGLIVLSAVGFLVVALQGLPSIEQLRDYQPPVTSRVHAGDGALVAEFAQQHRIFVPIESIPLRLRQAFIATEDQHFNDHVGVDPQGLMRATVANVINVFRGRRLEGASTITQQVAKNMLLSPDRTIIRKVREAILALRIEQALSKDQILELYLNEIFLGRRAYGVAAAALNYFNRPLDELTLGQMAFLAGLPRAPNNYDPVEHQEAAINRRNVVLQRMLEEGYITHAEMTAARAEPLTVSNRLSGEQYVASAQFVEEIRRQIVRDYGEQALQRGGLSIRSTLDTRLQLAAARALRTGLEQYDRRHAWRGPISSGTPTGDIAHQLRQAASPPGLTGWTRAMVMSTQGGVQVRLQDGPTGRLIDADVQWAAQGSRRETSRALRAGSIIYVSRASGASGRYNLRQVPQIQGALVALDPHTGRVQAMIGGYNLTEQGFNRATQAMRQPGSAFKPIVYAAALDFGLTPATLVDDGPLAISAGDGSIWSPENYTHEFFGPTTLRRGLEQSRNAMTARVAYEMGIERVVQYAQRMGVYDNNVQPVFALALGTGETTVIRLTAAYGEFVNGGRRIVPSIIDRIQDRNGRTIFRRDQRTCTGCTLSWSGQRPPTIADNRAQVLDPITAYQIVSMTQGVVERGTGSAVAALGIPLGGKTGTSNDYRNAWFVGYSPDLAVGVWLGFDDNRSMGEGSTGGSLAAPIFRDFMREALRGVPPTPFRIPPGVRLVRIDAQTGLLPGPTSTNTILEAFRPGTEPTNEVASSPFTFSDIDPSRLTGLEALADGSAPATRPPPRANPSGGGDENLGGLY